MAARGEDVLAEGMAEGICAGGGRNKKENKEYIICKELVLVGTTIHHCQSQIFTDLLLRLRPLPTCAPPSPPRPARPPRPRPLAPRSSARPPCRPAARPVVILLLYLLTSSWFPGRHELLMDRGLPTLFVSSSFDLIDINGGSVCWKNSLYRIVVVHRSFEGYHPPALF